MSVLSILLHFPGEKEVCVVCAKIYIPLYVKGEQMMVSCAQ